MKIIATMLILVLGSLCWGNNLPATPQPQASVEKDAGAWAFTAGTAATGIGAFTRPWIGFVAGTTIAVFGNGLQNSHNSHVDMLGGIGGAAVGYVIAKTLRHDWRKH
jgi:uncharacterized membrane protein YccC